MKTLTPKKTEPLFDVVAVNFKTGKVRIFARNKNERNADAILMMSVARRGVEEEFYSEAAPGKYQEGDEWTGNGLTDET